RTRPDLVGRIAGRWAGVPTNVSTMHWVGEWSMRGKALARAVHLLYRLTLPLTQHIVNIAAGEMQRMQAEGVRPDLMGVIHNGVDGDVFFPAHPQRNECASGRKGRPLVVGCVAFLSKRKGVSYLIEAF